MKILILLLSSVFSINAFAQVYSIQRGYDKPFGGMNGEIDSYTEKSYHIKYNEDGTEDKTLDEEVVCKFLKNGNIDEEIVTYKGQTYTKKYKKYDKTKVLEYERIVKTKRGTYRDRFTIRPINDSTDMMIYYDFINPEAQSAGSLITYHNNGQNTIKELTVSEDENITINQFDENGNIVEDKNTVNKEIRSWTKQTFNEKGLPVKRTILMWEYEPQNITETITYDKFDSKGNWTESTETNTQDKSKIIKERSFRYR